MCVCACARLCDFKTYNSVWTAKTFQSETEDECIIKGLERMNAADCNTK